MAVTGGPAGRGGAPLVVLDAAGGSSSAQVHDQLLAHVGTGRLRPGDRLPTVRGLAELLGLSTATVAKAYRRLEAAGVTLAATRAGTVVRDPSSGAGAGAGAGGGAGGGGDGTGGGGDGTGGAAAPVRDAAGSLAREAVAAGLDDAQAHSLLRGALRVARQP